MNEYKYKDKSFWILISIASVLVLMFGALVISVYWPTVHLYALFIDKISITLQPEKYIYYPIILSLIIIYGLWGMRYLYKKRSVSSPNKELS